MPGSIMLVTYKDLIRIPLGRHVSGGVIVYSGDYGRSKYAGIREVSVQQKSDTEMKLEESKQDMVADVDKCDEIYVYVGYATMNGAVELIRDLKALGKLVHMVACYCNAENKHIFVRDMGGISWIMSECGGHRAFADLIAQHTN